MILTHDTARKMLNVKDARIVGTVTHDNEHFYILENLVDQRTDHVSVGDSFFDDYVRFFDLNPE